MAKKQGAEKVQAVAMGHNSGNLRKGLDELVKIKKKQDEARMEALNVYNRLEDQGYDRKDVKILLKEMTKPLSAEQKARINQMREELGDLPLFNAALARLDESAEDAAA